MLREPELAADLTQDAFIKAYKNYETLEKPENARAWLYQIAHRVALDEIRRRKIIRFFPWTGESHGSAPSAEHLVMDAHLSGDMQRALARIPERQRAALLLAELHDLTGVELAAALGVSHVAARALLTRARESLRQALAAERAKPRPRLTSSEPQLASHGARPMSRIGRVGRGAPARPGGTARTSGLACAPPSARRPARPDRRQPGSTEHLATAPHVPAVAAAYEADRTGARRCATVPGAAARPVGADRGGDRARVPGAPGDRPVRRRSSRRRDRRSASCPGSRSSPSSSARPSCPAACFRDPRRRASSLPHRHHGRRSDTGGRWTDADGRRCR